MSRIQSPGGEVDVAKEQLDVLVKIQHDLKRQQEVQRATLTSQFLLGKMQETMSKLLTERSNDFERQRKAMMLYMEKESNTHQNSMDQIENVVAKVGTTLDQFTSSLTTLSSTIKDLSADQRSQGREHLDVLKGIHYEVQGTKGLLDHVRSNTLSTAKETKNLGWQVGELRSGSTDSQGTVSSNKGSLLYIISEDLKTSTESVMGAGTPPIPSRGFPPPPPMGMGYGAMGTPATPSTPNLSGYVPSFVAPANLPVLPK